MKSFKKGMIILWSGSVATIPKGWALCNGTNGTPNMCNCFIVAAGAAYSPDDTGGQSSHTHTYSSDEHRHTFSSGVGMNEGAEVNATCDFETVTGTTEVTDHRPSYYALAYIMKL